MDLDVLSNAWAPDQSRGARVRPPERDRLKPLGFGVGHLPVLSRFRMAGQARNVDLARFAKIEQPPWRRCSPA